MSVLANRLVCAQAVELVSDYVEGGLSRRDRRRLERHLAACDACGMYLAQVRAIIAACGVISPDDLAPETLEELTALFRRFQDDSA